MQQALWRYGIYDQIRELMPLQGSLSIERMCLLAGVSRAGFYRFLKAQVPSEEETEVRSAIQQVALQHRRRYGYRRVTAELKRRGMKVNHKRVARIMREDNLLALQPKEFATTTDSNEPLEVYLNLSRRMQLNWVDQLWVADITYIRVQTEFVYLAVILDGYSRKVVGWKLDRSLTSRLAVNALDGAIKLRRPRPGVVHHSDRGVQYTSPEYVAILKLHGMVQSMSRPANPYDNASCESFIKTLKREEIYANKYRDLQDLRSHIEEFIDGYYNQKRLHSALGYRTPEEFEAQTHGKTQAELYAPTLRFITPNTQNAKRAQEKRDSNGVPSPESLPTLDSSHQGHCESSNRAVSTKGSRQEVWPDQVG
ncbi:MULTISPECIES: IS3 family transposase [Acidobacterium]|nr:MULTISPECIES: IS3 family transposase [Acidobacterium]